MLKATLDPASISGFDATLRDLAAQLDRPLESLMRETGRLLARDLAFRVKPRGLSPSIGRSYRRTVADSVQSFYRPVGWLHTEIAKIHGEPLADALVAIVRRGDHAKAQRLLNSTLRLGVPRAVLVGPFDGGALHRRYRWRSLRRPPLHIVTDWPAAASYIRRTLDTVGLAKGALVNAGRQIDGGKTTGIPRWISRQSSAPGRGTLTRAGKRGFVGQIVSLLRYAREALPWSEEHAALDGRQAATEKRLQGAIQYNLKKAAARHRRYIRF